MIAKIKKLNNDDLINELETDYNVLCKQIKQTEQEIFLNGGATVFSTRYYPAPGDVSVKLTGAACELCNL